MKISVLLALLASTALGQGYSSISSPSSIAAGGGVTLATAQTITGAKTFSAALLTTASLRTTQGQKLTFDGATEAKYLSSNGTTLTLTGLTFTAATQGSTIAGLTVSGYLESTAILYVRGALNYITNDNGSDPLRLYDDNAVCVGNTTGTDCDGALQTGTLKIGTSGTVIDDSYAASATIDFASTSSDTRDSSSITVTGAAVGDVCSVGVPVAAQVSGAIFECFVTAADTVVVRLAAVKAGVDPASGTFTVRVFDP